MSGTDGDATPRLVDWAGGPPAMARLIDAFYDRVERDDLLSPFFPGGVSTEHRRHGTPWWMEGFGGPGGSPGGDAGAPLWPVDHGRPPAEVRRDDEPGGRRRRTSRRPGVPGRPCRL